MSEFPLLQTLARSANSARLNAAAFPESRLLRAHWDESERAIATVAQMIEKIEWLADALEDGHWSHVKNDLAQLAAKARGVE